MPKKPAKKAPAKKPAKKKAASSDEDDFKGDDSDGDYVSLAKKNTAGRAGRGATKKTKYNFSSSEEDWTSTKSTFLTYFGFMTSLFNTLVPKLKFWNFFD